MPIEGFDYKEFAESMASQAKELAPKELKDFEKEYHRNPVAAHSCRHDIVRPARTA